MSADPNPPQPAVQILTAGGVNYQIISPPQDTTFVGATPVVVRAQAPNGSTLCVKVDGINDLQDGLPADHYDLAFQPVATITAVIGQTYSHYDFNVSLDRTGVKANAVDAVLHLCLSQGGKWRVMRSLDIVLG